ncbi:hypothetical protein ACSBR1_007926 [Camellia fascicularis]
MIHQKLNGGQGFWLLPDIIKSIMIIENQFKPLPLHILLASYPKTGSIWLKALAISILSHNFGYRQRVMAKPINCKPTTPHELTPFLEMETFGENSSQNINKVPSPRVFNTHLPYSILPEHIKNSRCRVVYISRNPVDAFGHCSGRSFLRPCVGVLEREREKKNVFVITYEELKENPKESVRSLDEFLGCSLTPDEIEQVVWKSSHDRLSELDVNTDKVKGIFPGVPFNLYFQKGVGDGKNQLTTNMMERLEALENQRWEGSGLKLKLYRKVQNQIDGQNLKSHLVLL